MTNLRIATNCLFPSSLIHIIGIRQLIRCRIRSIAPRYCSGLVNSLSPHSRCKPSKHKKLPTAFVLLEAFYHIPCLCNMEASCCSCQLSVSKYYLLFLLHTPFNCKTVVLQNTVPTGGLTYFFILV